MKITGKMCIAFCEAAGLAVSMEQFDKGFRAAMKASDLTVAAGETWRHVLASTVCDVTRVCDGWVYVRCVGTDGLTGKVKIDAFLRYFKREDTRGVYIGLKS